MKKQRRLKPKLNSRQSTKTIVNPAPEDAFRDGQSDQADVQPNSRSIPPQAGGIAGLMLLAAFSSACLLFLVQPIVCKAILPWFGGSPTVWTTAMMFFQIALLLGYCYAHMITWLLPAKLQLVLHATLIVAALAFLPIAMNQELKPDGTKDQPITDIMVLLGGSIGLPFLLLASTAPLVQVWWHRIVQTTPYKLYAVSNAGSLLALLGYPFLLEPMAGTKTQLGFWSICFTGVAIALGISCFRNALSTAGVAHELATKASTQSITVRRLVLWLLLSSCGSVLLLAMTSQISQNVAAVPFFWVVPLAIYLVTFIFAFADAGYYNRRVCFVGMIATITAVAYMHLNYEHPWISRHFILSVIVHWLALFFTCMVCHGELARIKPDPTRLTLFFLIVSIGGALGGIFVNLIAPMIFSTYLEYPLALIGTLALLGWIVARDDKSILCLRRDCRDGRTTIRWLAVLLACAPSVYLLEQATIRNTLANYFSQRGFYGVVQVRPSSVDQEFDSIEMRHGTITHGSQYVDPQRRDVPTQYYKSTTGLGFALQWVDQRKPDKKIGMLGLGVGTIAAYANEGDTFRAYEINQQVIDLATNPDVFSFWDLIRKRNADGQIILGDARLSLERELRENDPQDFDLLAVDVFSGDAIPVHLLTDTAFESYFQHLAADGILAVHISNQYLDLLPVVYAVTSGYDMTTAVVSSDDCQWVLVCKMETMNELVRRHPDAIRVVSMEAVQPWTDDYSNLLGSLK